MVGARCTADQSWSLSCQRLWRSSLATCSRERLRSVSLPGTTYIVRRSTTSFAESWRCTWSLSGLSFGDLLGVRWNQNSWQGTSSKQGRYLDLARWSLSWYSPGSQRALLCIWSWWGSCRWIRCKVLVSPRLRPRWWLSFVGWVHQF